MKKRDRTIWFGHLLMATILFLPFLSVDAIAADAPADWRPTYDLVMRWVNFFILAFLIVKFGKAPLMNFLRGQQDEFEEEIREMEKKRETALEKLRETEKLLNESNERFEKISARIIAMGEKRKREIIEEAKRDSRMMIEDAKGKITGKILQAKENFKAELVDAAISIATEQLTGVITQEDNEKLFSQYMNSIET